MFQVCVLKPTEAGGKLFLYLFCSIELRHVKCTSNVFIGFSVDRQPMRRASIIKIGVCSFSIEHMRWSDLYFARSKVVISQLIGCQNKACFWLADRAGGGLLSRAQRAILHSFRSSIIWQCIICELTSARFNSPHCAHFVESKSRTLNFISSYNQRLSKKRLFAGGKIVKRWSIKISPFLCQHATSWEFLTKIPLCRLHTQPTITTRRRSQCLFLILCTTTTLNQLLSGREMNARG